MHRAVSPAIDWVKVQLVELAIGAVNLPPHELHLVCDLQLHVRLGMALQPTLPLRLSTASPRWGGVGGHAARVALDV